MVVYDVNGDGLNDVITSIKAHEYGLAWYEQVKENGEITFKEHLILNKNATKNSHGVSFSQLHSLALVDIDGDGRDKVAIGYSLWNNEGQKLWSQGQKIRDHADGVMIGNLSGDPKAEPRMAQHRESEVGGHRPLAPRGRSARWLSPHAGCRAGCRSR